MTFWGNIESLNYAVYYQYAELECTRQYARKLEEEGTKVDFG